MTESKAEIQENININWLILNKSINKCLLSIYFYFDSLRHFMMQNHYI